MIGILSRAEDTKLNAAIYACRVLMLSACCAWVLAPATMSAQSRRTPPAAAARAGDQEKAPAAVATPSAQEKEAIKRGEALFNRQCPICHLGRPDKTRPFIGRNLRGILKGAKPPQEKVVRDFILKGSDHMPGFEHNMTPEQIDDLMGFLKTYN